MRKKVFICNPFRGDMEGNAKKAAAYSRMACEEGYLPIAPPGGEAPLDYQKIIESSSEVLVVATNAETGEAKYFDKGDMKQDCYDILKVSSAIPFVCRPYSVEGIPYYDGALRNCSKITFHIACLFLR